MAASSEASARRRFGELDALRGVAALIVLLGHGLRSTPYWEQSELLRTLDRTPLHLLVAGRESVVLFFVLSGFVLSLPFWAGRTTSYRGYAVKRIFRIYLPYLAAMGIAITLFLSVGQDTIPGMNEFFNKHWSRPLTRRAVFDHLLFIKPFDSGEYGMVYWSLIHELRVSLIFPLVMFGVVRVRTIGSIALAMAASAVATAYCYARGWRIGDGSSEWPVSLHITALFVIGALVAKHRDTLIGRLAVLGRAPRLLVVTLGGGIFLYARHVSDIFGEHATTQAAEHWLIAGGAATIIVAVMTAAEGSLFERPALSFLGRHSYGLYLYHAAILWALVYTLHSNLPLAVIVALGVPVSLGAAWLSYRFIEQPSIAWGQSLAASIATRRGASKSPRHDVWFVAGVWNRAAHGPASRPTWLR